GPSILPFEAIPLRVLNTDAHAAGGICSPAAGGHEERIEKSTVTIFGLHQKAGVEQARPGFVVEVAAVFPFIAIDSDPAIAKLDRRGDQVIAGVRAGGGCSWGVISSFRLICVGSRAGLSQGKNHGKQQTQHCRRKHLPRFQGVVLHITCPRERLWTTAELRLSAEKDRARARTVDLDV